MDATTINYLAMKTYIILFAILAACSLIGALCGATHQYGVFAFLCLLITALILAVKQDKDTCHDVR